jgi:hypothetical protein
MATKTPAAKTAAAPAAAAPTKEAKVPLSKMRGPRGVAETAKIKLIATENPKRPNSKAHKFWTLYKDGMTVGQYCDAVDATELKGGATPALVYDTSHGFISIEGYTPSEIKTPKPKAPKAPKEPKGKPVAAKKGPAKRDEEADEEVMD